MMREKKERRRRPKSFVSVLCGNFSHARWKRISVCGGPISYHQVKIFKGRVYSYLWMEEGILCLFNLVTWVPTSPILPNSLQNLCINTMTFSFGMKRLKALFRSSSDLSHLVMLPPLTERNIEFLANQSGWDPDDELTEEHSRESKISEWLQLLPWLLRENLRQ